MLIGVFIIILKHMVNILATIPKIMILGIVMYIFLILFPAFKAI